VVSGSGVPSRHSRVEGVTSMCKHTVKKLLNVVFGQAVLHCKDCGETITLPVGAVLPRWEHHV
jgi:hypothetical protein